MERPGPYQAVRACGSDPSMLACVHGTNAWSACPEFHELLLGDFPKKVCVFALMNVRGRDVPSFVLLASFTFSDGVVSGGAREAALI